MKVIIMGGLRNDEKVNEVIGRRRDMGIRDRFTILGLKPCLAK